ncbi:unnamed protein product [Rotaria sp. Silwood2]|nr:unnamed protein product [Rotaria sp. Silwood2]CAF4276384.1 unnamed protein product [Rotaria sp. Silwood2]
MTIEPDDVTLVVLLNACVKTGNERAIKGKSGLVDQAFNVFKSVSNPKIITYTSMVNAFGLNGMDAEAIDLYRQIPTDERNEVSHICTSNACSHSALLHETQTIFNDIDSKTETIVTIMAFLFQQ